MPLEVTIEVDPAYKPSDEEKEAYEAAKRKGPIKVDYVTGMENLRRAKGMYRLAYDPADGPAPATKRFEDMPDAELKQMMLQHGWKPGAPGHKKQVTRQDAIDFIKKQMDQIEFSE